MVGVQNLLVMTFQIEENFPGGGGEASARMS